MSKSKFPREKALEVAREIHSALQPHAVRIKVAGSLRRGMRFVSDIEFVVIPKVEMLDSDLFGDVKTPRDETALEIERLIGWGALAKRRNSIGSETWGQKNKLALHVASGIPVDFFFTTERNWFMTLFVRTGPKALNIKVATLAKKKGWHLEAYGCGFYNPSLRTTFPVDSEEAIFRFVGLPFIPPDRRR
jgi:DNA polymerase/3'-5' exonuclease PolX